MPILATLPPYRPMASVEKTVLIERTPAEMFDLVDKVERYPEFLPWCNRTELKFRNDSETVATLHINFHAVRSHFTTRNGKVFPAEMIIRLVDGPFRRLEGNWHFRALGDSACKVEFRLHYEFSSRLFEKVIGPVFNHIASTFVDAFVKRADQIYGGNRA